METIKDLRLAVLIDADNIPYASVKEMMEEIAKYGTPTTKRIYADWTRPTLAGWKKVLLENAITPVQQYSYSTGKNSSDSAMIIDAMDILYSGRVDGFCIVSSDSDFTRLAIRLREAGMKVIGIGERKTLTALISACDKFIYLEILRRQPEETATQPTANKQRRVMKKDLPHEVPVNAAPVEAVNEPNEEVQVPSPPPTVSVLNNDVINLIATSINDIADEAGWAFVGDLGNLMLKKQPDFDARNYGFKKLVPLLKSLTQFEIDERESGRAKIKHVFVRIRP